MTFGKTTACDLLLELEDVTKLLIVDALVGDVDEAVEFRSDVRLHTVEHSPSVFRQALGLDLDRKDLNHAAKVRRDFRVAGKVAGNHGAP